MKKKTKRKKRRRSKRSISPPRKRGRRQSLQPQPSVRQKSRRLRSVSANSSKCR